MRMIEFPYRFVENPIGPFEKPKQKDLQSQIKNWGPQFMLLLLEQYTAVYKVEGLIPTEKVLSFTNSIRGENDSIAEWLMDTYEQTKDNNVGVGQKDMMALYRRTAENRQSKPNLKAAVKRVFDIDLSSHVQKRGDKGFRGLSLIEKKMWFLTCYW